MIGDGRSHCPLTVYKIAISLFFLANRILGLGTLCVFQGRWPQIHGKNNDWPEPVVLSGGIDFVPQGTFNNVWRYFWLPQLGENCYWHLTGEAGDATQQLTTVQHRHCKELSLPKSQRRETLQQSHHFSGPELFVGDWLRHGYVMQIYLIKCKGKFTEIYLKKVFPARLHLAMGFSRQEYWSGLPCLLQGIFPTQELNPSRYVSCIGSWVLYH